MRLSDITIEVRNGQFQRVGQILPQDLTINAVSVYNNVGQWTVKLRNDHPMAPVLASPGSGLVITGPAGNIIFSGPMTQPQYDVSSDQPGSQATFTGVTDDVILADRLAWPQPSNSDVTTQSVGSDNRTGPAETLMYQYVSANCGPTAPTLRRNPYLSLASDQGRGTTLTKQVRFAVLGTLCGEIASVDNLGFNVLQADSGIVFSVFQPVDRSGTVRLSVANGDLSTQTVQVNAPAATQAIVGGAGQLTDRFFVGVSTPASQAAEAAWGRRIETFIDQRQYNGTNLMTQAGNDALASGGSTTISIQTTPSANISFQYGVDYSLGDLIAVELADGTEAAVRVTGFALNADDSGFNFGVTLSDNASFLENDYASRIQALEQKVGNLQKNGEAAKDTGWTVITPASGFVDGGNGTSDPSWAYRVKDGICHIRGLVKPSSGSFATSSTITVSSSTLPVPYGTKSITTWGVNGLNSVRVTITSGGLAQVITGTTAITYATFYLSYPVD